MTDCVQSVQTYLSTLPAATRLCLVANATLFCLQSLGFVTAVGMCTHPAAALGLEGGGSSSFQPWRLFTPAWFHGGLLHIAMNMSALTGMGPALERILGSLHTALLLLALACRQASAQVSTQGPTYSAVAVDKKTRSGVEDPGPVSM